MPTQVQVRGATQATQEARTLVSRELDVNTTDDRIAIHNGSDAGGVPHLNFKDAQNQEFVYAAGSGTNAVTITLAKAPSAYAAGQKFAFRAANTNTGSVTLNVNSLGAKTVKKVSSDSIVALGAGDILQNGIYEVTYDGTDFLLLSLSKSSGYTKKASASGTTPVAKVTFLGVFSADKSYQVVIAGAADGTALSNQLEFRLMVSSASATSWFACGASSASGTDPNKASVLWIHDPGSAVFTNTHWTSVHNDTYGAGGETIASTNQYTDLEIRISNDSIRNYKIIVYEVDLS